MISAAATVTQRDISRIRLYSHLVAGDHGRDSAGVVDHMMCVQGQHVLGGLEAVAVRGKHPSTAAVQHAFDERALVRSWTQRGTIHITTPRHLRVMLTLTGQRQIRAGTRGRLNLGLDDEVVHRVIDLTVDELSALPADRPSMPRVELVATWMRHGYATEPGQAYSLFSHLAKRGHVVLTMDGSVADQRVALTETWLGTQASPDEDEALAIAARRYVSSHGPATRRDFAWWLGLPLGHADRGLAELDDGFEQVEAGGQVQHVAGEALEAWRAGTKTDMRARLLPQFDEAYLGYQDRTAVLGSLPPTIVDPKRNGVFRPIVIRAGRIIATWRGNRGAQLEVRELHEHGPLPAIAHREIGRAWREYPAPH